ncbi:MAG: zinc ribbon domain-containing protein [Anaerolineaceae bacterium]
MPVYEYQCLDCQTSFEMMRSFSDSDAVAACQGCSSHNTRRKMSTFFAHGDSRSTSNTSQNHSSGGCSGCSGGSCGSCHH